MKVLRYEFAPALTVCCEYHAFIRAREILTPPSHLILPVLHSILAALRYSPVKHHQWNGSAFEQLIISSGFHQ